MSKEGSSLFKREKRENSPTEASHGFLKGRKLEIATRLFYLIGSAASVGAALISFAHGSPAGIIALPFAVYLLYLACRKREEQH